MEEEEEEEAEDIHQRRRADAAEELRHVARIRSSPRRNASKNIYRETREREKKIRGRIGDARESRARRF